MTWAEEWSITGRLDALDEGKDPRNDPPEPPPTGDEAWCECCGAQILTGESLNVVWVEAACRECLKRERPEIGELIAALEMCRDTVWDMQRIRVAANEVAPYMVALEACQGRLAVMGARLNAIGV